jgi:hypothetical protein
MAKKHVDGTTPVGAAKPTNSKTVMVWRGYGWVRVAAPQKSPTPHEDTENTEKTKEKRKD